MSALRISTVYTFISLVASCSNLILQYIFLTFYSVEFSIAFATLVILPFKFIADKKLIFSFVPEKKIDNLLKFIAYTSVSIFTVTIFWGVEFAFHLYFEDVAARYLGGAIGLTFSFYLKYLLDKRYVFNSKDI